MYRPGSSLSKAKGPSSSNTYGLGLPVKKVKREKIIYKYKLNNK